MVREPTHLIGARHVKTVPGALGDLQRGPEVVEFAAGIPHLLKGEFTDNAGGGIDVHSPRRPSGVKEGASFTLPTMGRRP
ncbi:hypothetical protein LUZ64_24710 [Streptomyces albireticuli]|nr:hypothetical protein [Streptomyces albireticuli]